MAVKIDHLRGLATSGRTWTAFRTASVLALIEAVEAAQALYDSPIAAAEGEQWQALGDALGRFDFGDEE